MIDIKPCPHCQSDKFVRVMTSKEISDCNTEGCEYSESIMVAVCCSYNDGGCGATGGFRDGVDDCIHAWNTGARP